MNYQTKHHQQKTRVVLEYCLHRMVYCLKDKLGFSGDEIDNAERACT